VVSVRMTALTYSKSGPRGHNTVVLQSALYPTEQHRAARIERARRVRWWAAIALGCLAAVVGCTPSDDGGGDDASARTHNAPAVMPSGEQLTGFTRVGLVPADPPAMASGTGKQAPGGTFWYRLMASAGDAGASVGGEGTSFEWYVYATHLQPEHAYRLDLVVDGNTLYSIGNGASDAQGDMSSHGTAIDRFTDQYCVGTATPPMPVAGKHAVRLMLKSDGSGSGPASAAGALTDPARSYPCHGNGDGVFEYWLVMRSPITIGASASR
jgi:hypothetical protein